LHLLNHRPTAAEKFPRFLNRVLEQPVLRNDQKRDKKNRAKQPREKKNRRKKHTFVCEKAFFVFLKSPALLRNAQKCDKNQGKN
jgi:hypothetical protein